MPSTNQINGGTESNSGPAVAPYTRAQALEAGTLVDAGMKAREAGFRWPVALTRSAWNCCVAWTVEDSARQVGQHESGRLWDVVYIASYALGLVTGSGDQLLFPVYRVPRDGVSVTPQEVTLKIALGAGDSGEPVVTIMLPNED